MLEPPQEHWNSSRQTIKSEKMPTPMAEGMVVGHTGSSTELAYISRLLTLCKKPKCWRLYGAGGGMEKVCNCCQKDHFSESHSIFLSFFRIKFIHKEWDSTGRVSMVSIKVVARGTQPSLAKGSLIPLLSSPPASYSESQLVGWGAGMWIQDCVTKSLCSPKISSNGSTSAFSSSSQARYWKMPQDGQVTNVDLLLHQPLQAQGAQVRSRVNLDGIRWFHTVHCDWDADSGWLSAFPLPFLPPLLTYFICPNFHPTQSAWLS